MFPVAKKTAKHAEVKMYGDVGVWADVNAKNIKSLLDDIKKEGYEKVTFLVHSPGGSVFEGIAIKNAIIASGLEVEFVIEGIAASMMTQIMLAGKTIAYADAKIMLHEARSAPFGNAKRLRQEADLLDKINSDMAENYAQKTGKTKEWILQNWLKDGLDTWFSAKEAYEAGLIDGVINENKLQKALSVKNEDYQSLVAHYNTQLLNKNDMKKELEALLELFGEPAAQGADASEQDLIGKISAKINSIIEENKILKAQQQKEVLEAIKNKMQQKGIPGKQQDIYLELAKTNLEAVKSLIEVMPSQIVQVKNTAQVKSQEQDRSQWTYSDWEKNDPEGLLALMKNDPAKFEKLVINY